jgi:hypothetical protein
MHVKESIGQPQVVIGFAQVPQHIVFSNVSAQCLDETLTLEVSE